MSGIILNPTAEGLRLIADNFEIMIDTTDSFSGSADAFLISNIHSFSSSLYKHKVPVFVAAGIKNISFHTATDDEFTIICTPGKAYTLRKERKKALEFRFIEFESAPMSNLILIDAKGSTIAYTTGIVPKPELIPHCDTLIINCHQCTPIISMLKNIPEFTVSVDDYSKLYDILSCFNHGAPDNSVGIDHTVLDAACHYLKNDCTVFSKAIKPLSQYKKLPPVIITSDAGRYPFRPVVSGSLFLPQITLSDIYKTSVSANANNIIAFCPGYDGDRKRGNLTITGKNTMFEI